MYKLLALLGVAGVVSVGGHYALRSYLRSAVLKELQSNKSLAVAYEMDAALQKISALAGKKLTLNLPPPEALAESLVPFDSLISPYDAADDIGKNGRFSKYWPADYKRGSLDPTIELNILKIFANMAAAGKKKELAGS